MHYNVHCYSCLSSDNTNKYYMILSTHTRGCVILNVHIPIGFKYHEYYPKRCLTGNCMFSSEHEISDISKLHFHSCIWDRCGRDRMVVRFTLPVQSMPITTNVVSWKPVHGEVYSVQQYVISLSVTCDRSVVFSGYSGFLHQ